MSKSNVILSALVAAVGASLSQPVLAHTVDEKLGKVHFETSCTPAAAAAFDQGMLYQHSFWYSASQRAFNEALEADPKCGIAYWGIALSLLWNPHAAPPAKNLAEGAAIIAKGQEVGAATERERDYLTALSAMYADYEKVDHRTRVLNYAKAMEQLAAKYPNDDEAQIHYALALNVSASPTDKTYANQLKGAAILETIWTRQPDHPGVAHYLIHLYDTPALAEKGLPAALRYAKVAPDAPHAQHMPSHIFTRVGYWQQSIDSNTVAARVAKADKSGHDQLHAMDYEVYAYLQLGQDAQAKAVIDDMVTVSGFTETFLAGPFALAASPARYAVERGDWKEAAALEVRPSPLPYVTAISWFAKALGAARSGDTVAGSGGNRPPDRATRSVAREEGRLLVRAGGHSGAGRDRLDAIRGRTPGRGVEGAGRCRGCRGQDREAPGYAGTVGAGQGTLWRHAAPARQRGGGARGVRGNDAQGAKSPQRDLGRRELGRGLG